MTDNMHGYVNTADCILVSDSTFVTQLHIVVFLTAECEVLTFIFKYSTGN
jgi:hypothetical protein